MKYTYAASAIAAALLVTGCANSDNAGRPDLEYHTAESNITIEELYTKANTTVQKYESDDIMEAYVSSSDEDGTFYKSVSFQNLEGTAGFSVSVDMYNIHNDVKPGRKVYIYLKDLYFAIVHGSLVLGSLYQETSIGRIKETDFYKKIRASEVMVAENDLVQQRTLAQLKNNHYINTLVDVINVQFEEEAVGKTFYDADNAFGGATSYKVVDATASMIFRTSEFARFAHKTVPSNSGKIRGVLTKFNSNFQFMARRFSDIQLTEERIRKSTAIGGTAMVFAAAVNENFESFAVGDHSTAFPAYGNDYAEGGRYWAVKSFQNNKYIQLNAFGTSSAVTKSYFIIPVKFNGNNTLSFNTKDGYYNGNVLNVYYVTADRYSYGVLINASNFYNITDQFTYASGTTDGYAAHFTFSGLYAFPSSANGDGYILFEYSGTQTVTTTIQIDNIKFQ